MFNIYLLITSIFLQSFSFLSIKFSTQVQGTYIIFLLVLALFFLILRAIIWQKLLRNIELSYIYPFASFVQVLIFSYSILIFKEDFNVYNIFGLSIMLSGIYLVSRGPKPCMK